MRVAGERISKRHDTFLLSKYFVNV
jgi:hypothetical protein